MWYKERPVGDLRREAAERGGVGESALLWCLMGIRVGLLGSVLKEG